jgi:RluA family pseudouridine synthase
VDVLFIDESILVLNKPAGMAVLPGGWDGEAAAIVTMAQESHGRLWVVHRLDKSTSGVLLFARTADAHRALNRQFELRETRKTYHAIVVGQPAWQNRNCRLPLRTNVGHKHRTQINRLSGRLATTHFSVSEKLKDSALLVAVPYTGRTHQVRAHAAALGHPLVGDVLYGAPPTELIGRAALHASSLRIRHPISGSEMSFHAPYPDDLQLALESLRSPKKQHKPR